MTFFRHALDNSGVEVTSELWHGSEDGRNGEKACARGSLADREACDAGSHLGPEGAASSGTAREQIDPGSCANAWTD
jgi:hypothetical protein